MQPNQKFDTEVIASALADMDGFMIGEEELFEALSEAVRIKREEAHPGLTEEMARFHSVFIEQASAQEVGVGREFTLLAVELFDATSFVRSQGNSDTEIDQINDLAYLGVLGSARVLLETRKADCTEEEEEILEVLRTRIGSVHFPNEAILAVPYIGDRVTDGQLRFIYAQYIGFDLDSNLYTHYYDYANEMSEVFSS